MRYLRIPGRTYDLVINLERICFVQEGPRGMAIYYAGHSGPQLLSGDQCRPLLEALHEHGAALPVGWATDE